MRRARATALALLLLALPLAAAAASEGEEGSARLWFEIGNLVLLIGVIIFFARKPVKQYLAERRQRIEDNIRGSERLLTEAEERLEEWQSKAARLDNEVAEIKRLARERAERERQRILADAERSAQRIQRDAEAAIDREVRRARKVLQQEAADLAVKLAEERLKSEVTEQDRERLVSEFVTTVANGQTRTN